MYYVRHSLLSAVVHHGAAALAAAGAEFWDDASAAAAAQGSAFKHIDTHQWIKTYRSGHLYSYLTQLHKVNYLHSAPHSFTLKRMGFFLHIQFRNIFEKTLKRGSQASDWVAIPGLLDKK